MFEQFKRGVYDGAVHGLLAWIVYAVIEFICVAAPPLMARSNSVFTSWDWSAMLVLFSGYAVLGLICGAAIGAVFPARHIPTGIALTLALGAISSAATTGPLELQEKILLASGLVLAVVFAVLLSHGFEASLASAKFGPPLAGRPNVVLITLDTVQAGHLSLYGYGRNTTPYLGRLAEETTLYTNATAVSDMTLPSHASIFTGLYPQEHRAHTDPPLRARPLAEGFQTGAEMLASNGCATLAIAANRFYVQPEWGLAQGFQFFDSQAPVRMFNEDRRFFLREGLRKVLNLFISTWEYDLHTRRAGELNHDISRLMTKMKEEGRSFFFSGSMKFIRSTKGKRELYDLSSDLHETQNLYDPDDKRLAKLQSDLDEWFRRVKPDAAASVEIVPESLRRLKSLGYVQ